jgi:hypothetical protein
MTRRHKTNWDRVAEILDDLGSMLRPEWHMGLVDELRANLMPRIEKVRLKRPKAAEAKRAYSRTPRGKAKIREYNRKYVAENRGKADAAARSERKRKRDEIALARFVAGCPGSRARLLGHVRLPEQPGSV